MLVATVFSLFSEEAINEKPQDLSSKSNAIASIPLPPDLPQTPRPQIIVSPRKSDLPLESSSHDSVSLPDDFYVNVNGFSIPRIIIVEFIAIYLLTFTQWYFFSE